MSSSTCPPWQVGAKAFQMFAVDGAIRAGN
jgi:hypothetical protein